MPAKRVADRKARPPAATTAVDAPIQDTEPDAGAGSVDAGADGAGDATATTAAGPGRRPQRTHRGRTLEQRRAERRAALREAALELFGSQGYANTSIGELCRTSFVTTRYFYEEYGDRESLLLDLYEHLLHQVVAAVVSVEEPPGPDYIRAATRARVAAFVHSVVADERAARVVLLESGSAALEARRREAHLLFAEFVASRAFPYVERGELAPHDTELLALMFVGAVNESVTHWLLAPPDERPDIEHIIDTLVAMYLVVRAGFER